jgi:hypothetical protein
LLSDFFGEKRTGLVALVLMILGAVLVASGKSFALLTTLTVAFLRVKKQVA